MNRVLSLVFILLAMMMISKSAADEPFQAKSIRYSGGPYRDELFEYRLLTPANVVSDKKYPLVIFLHGAGERGTDNKSQLKYLPEPMATSAMRKAFPCFLLAPQCRKEKQWVNVPWGDKQSTPMDETPSHQLRTVVEMIKVTLAEQPVDRQRVYVTGLSMGGYGAWELAARHPDRVAALAPICGGGDEKQAKKFAKMPIWAFHGDKDGAVPVGRARSMVEAIRDVGNKRVKYSELPDVGHNSWLNAYSNESGLLEWMFQQKLSDR
ncbi:MAG: alpha/beta fold hydrolase [Pirellulaceae bacterium]